MFGLEGALAAGRWLINVHTSAAARLLGLVKGPLSAGRLVARHGAAGRELQETALQPSMTSSNAEILVVAKVEKVSEIA